LLGLEEYDDDDAENFLSTQLNWINRIAKKEYTLPPGACFWQQGSLIKGIPTGPSKPNCKFQVFVEIRVLSSTFVNNVCRHYYSVFRRDGIGEEF